MATVHSGRIGEKRDAHVLSVARLAIAGGITAAVVFVLCWLGTFASFSSPTHAYIGLFTSAEFRSGLALAQGFCWSLLFGVLVGAIFALAYNMTSSLGRK